MAEKDLESEKLELSLFGRKPRRGRKRSTDETEATAAAPEWAESGTAESGTAVSSESARRPEPVESTEPAAPSRSAGPVATPHEDPAADAPTAALPRTPPVTTGGGATAVGGDTTASSSGPASRTTTATTGGRRRRGARKATTPRRQRQAPSMAAPVAALAVGAAVGLAAVVLTYASLKACELVTGTDSCGGPGLFVLLAVVVLMILGGSAALSMLGVPESGGISFLGVAMFVALCLVVLLPNLLEPWMIVVAPVLCALTFLLAHWIVTRFDEDILETDGPPQYDVR